MSFAVYLNTSTEQGRQHGATHAVGQTPEIPWYAVDEARAGPLPLPVSKPPRSQHWQPHHVRNFPAHGAQSHGTSAGNSYSSVPVFHGLRIPLQPFYVF